MNLHKTVANLVEAQNNHDSKAYAACFTETAIVHDEGKTHRGKSQVQQWNEHSNQQYQTVLKPLNYQENEGEHLFTAEVSGSFSGSPAVLHFHLAFEGGLISSLSITA